MSQENTKPKKQSEHDVRYFPIVDTIVVDGRTINIRCNRDYEEAKRDYWASLQRNPAKVRLPSLPSSKAGE